jgi:hypothetical protein
MNSELENISFEDLPDEIILSILSQLDNENLLRAKRINKLIKHIINDDDLLRERVSKIFIPSTLISYDNTFPKVIEDLIEEPEIVEGQITIDKIDNELLINYKYEKYSHEFRLNVYNDDFRIYSHKSNYNFIDFICLNILVLHKEFLHIFSYFMDDGFSKDYFHHFKINILKYKYITVKDNDLYLLTDKKLYYHKIGNIGIYEYGEIIEQITNNIIIMGYKNFYQRKTYLCVYGNKGFFKPFEIIRYNPYSYDVWGVSVDTKNSTPLHMKILSKLNEKIYDVDLLMQLYESIE